MPIIDGGYPVTKDIIPVFESVNVGSTVRIDRILDCVCDQIIFNGVFGYIGEKVEGKTHVYKFIPGFKSGEKLVVVDQPAWTPNTNLISNQRRDKFLIPAGKTFRVRILSVGDEFAMSKEGFKDGEGSFLSVGKYVYVDDQNGYPLHVANDVESIPEGNAYGVVTRQRMVGAALITDENQFLDDNLGYGRSRVMYDIRMTRC